MLYVNTVLSVQTAINQGHTEAGGHFVPITDEELAKVPREIRWLLAEVTEASPKHTDSAFLEVESADFEGVVKALQSVVKKGEEVRTAAREEAARELDAYLQKTPGERVCGVDHKAEPSTEGVKWARILKATGGPDRLGEVAKAVEEAEVAAKTRRIAWLTAECERLLNYHIDNEVIIPHWAWKDREVDRWVDLRKFVYQLKLEGGPDFTDALKEADNLIRHNISDRNKREELSRRAWMEWGRTAGSLDLRYAIEESYPLGRKIHIEFLKWLCPEGVGSDVERLIPAPENFCERTVPSEKSRELQKLVSAIVKSAAVPDGTEVDVSRILSFTIHKNGSDVSKRTGVVVEVKAPHLDTPLTAAYLVVEKP